MNKKKVLILMAMLTVATMVTACGGKKEEAAVTESEAVESTVVESVENTDVTESTELIIEDDSDVALAESVEKTEEEMSVVEYNAEILKIDIDYGEQAIEVALKLEELGFGKIVDIYEYESGLYYLINDKDEQLKLYETYEGDYFEKIKTMEGELIWEWEYTDKYRVERDEDPEEYKIDLEAAKIESDDKNVQILSEYIFYDEQAIEVAEALKEVGFGTIEEVINNRVDYLNIKDDSGMVVQLYYYDTAVPEHAFFRSIFNQETETVLWKWDTNMFDKYLKSWEERREKLVQEMN